MGHLQSAFGRLRFFPLATVFWGDGLPVDPVAFSGTWAKPSPAALLPADPARYDGPRLAVLAVLLWLSLCPARRAA